MYTEYLKNKLAEIAALKQDVARIREQNVIGGHPNYPAISGGLDALVGRASIYAKSALEWTANYVEPAEREAQRFVSIFETIGIETDESTLATLELIGKRTFATAEESGQKLWERSPYKSERTELAGHVMRIVAEVQESEREFEYEQANEAIAAAGFVRHEDDDFEGWVRGSDAITIEMTYKRHVTTYAWELIRNHGSETPTVAESGKSGEFHRLLALIAPVSTTPTPTTSHAEEVAE